MNSDKRSTPQNWEAALGQALKNLPERQAPDTLMTSVMARIRARAAQPWYRRSWWQWPAAIRFASAAALLALLALPSLFGGQFRDAGVSPVLDRLLDTAQTLLASLAGAAETVFHAGSGFGPAGLRWVLVGASLLLLMMYLTCIGVGTFVYRTLRR